MSKPPPNYYHVLGVTEDSDDEAIKSAYRRLAKVLHPDANKRPTADREFKDLQEAFGILSNPDLRRDFNATLALAKISDEPPDLIDNMMSNCSITQPKKKKKKKKKKVRSHQEQEDDRIQDIPIHHVPYPRSAHPQPQQRQGRADFEDIPPGYDHDVDFL